MKDKNVAKARNDVISLLTGEAVIYEDEHVIMKHMLIPALGKSFIYLVHGWIKGNKKETHYESFCDIDKADSDNMHIPYETIMSKLRSLG